MKRAFSRLILVALLAACGTPQEQCIGTATRELTAVRELRAEVAANLARGYGWESYEVARMVWVICGEWPPKEKGGEGRPRYCLEEEKDVFRRRVAIDPEAEGRKLAGLKAREAALSREAAAAIAECKVVHPE